MGSAELFTKDVWTALGGVLGLIGAGLSIIALIQSSRTQRASIPAPTVRPDPRGAMRIAMRDEDAQRFGIIALRCENDLIQRMTEVGQINEETGSYVLAPRAYEEAAAQLNFPTPQGEIMVGPYFLGTEVIEALVVSRAEPSVKAWVKLDV